MKALIIENEYELDESIQAFLKDFPDLFEEVQEELFCLQRGKEELLPYILESDAIIVASTWMYKGQLEEFIDAFLDKRFPKKISFFIHNFVHSVNEWKHGFSQEKRIFEKIVKLHSSGHTINDFGEGYKGEQINDGLNYIKTIPRTKYVYYKVSYSKPSKLFYSKHQFYTLKEVQEDEKRYK